MCYLTLLKIRSLLRWLPKNLYQAVLVRLKHSLTKQTNQANSTHLGTYLQRHKDYYLPDFTLLFLVAFFSSHIRICTGMKSDSPGFIFFLTLKKEYSENIEWRDWPWCAVNDNMKTFSEWSRVVENRIMFSERSRVVAINSNFFQSDEKLVRVLSINCVP